MDRRKAVIYLLTTVLLWSTGGLFVKILDWHPLAVSGVRSAIAAFIIWIYLRRPQFAWSTTLIGGGIAYLLYSRSIRYLRTIKAVLIQTLEPILNPIWVFLLLDENLAPGRWRGQQLC
jgi:drug/metabolite transporter (DMT)-like permease